MIREDEPITISTSRRVGLDNNLLFTGTLFSWEQSLPHYSNQPSSGNRRSLQFGRHEY